MSCLMDRIIRIVIITESACLILSDLLGFLFSLCVSHNFFKTMTSITEATIGIYICQLVNPPIVLNGELG